jgi:membrane associated rhomboid family serine protease
MWGILKEDRIIIKREKIFTLKNLLLLTSLIAFFFGSLMLVPANPVQGGTVVNTIAHLIGFAGGFWLAFFILRE